MKKIGKRHKLNYGSNPCFVVILGGIDINNAKVTTNVEPSIVQVTSTIRCSYLFLLTMCFGRETCDSSLFFPFNKTLASLQEAPRKNVVASCTTRKKEKYKNLSGNTSPSMCHLAQLCLFWELLKFSSISFCFVG